MLSFDSVSFAYQQTPVLRDLSFQISSGEIVGYLGVNGAGKTTTFLLATGLLEPTGGTVEIAGYDPGKSKKWCHDVGVLTAGAGLYPRLTVRRNLSFFAELYSKKVDL
ncbi:MAG: ATP-binding cassette domain-containing protein, partial [Candidatus Eremiobacteraeota bacterium]|nr:ATP-binding cassette domain-containing protein [Candidatus Eremiobacteraeota bacterium]